LNSKFKGKISWPQPWAHDHMMERLLNYGIRQLSYRQGKRLPNKNMKIKFFFYLPTVMMQVPSYNNHCHAHIVIGKLEITPPTTYKPPVVVAYRL
jgi:hypothetical protein